MRIRSCIEAVIESLRRLFFRNTGDEATPMLSFWGSGNHTPLIIDGSKDEGGGQLVYEVLSYSAILGKPVIIENIRANREGPKGLLQDHTNVVCAIGRLCNATIKGNFVGSGRIEFLPFKKLRRRGKLEKVHIQAEKSAVNTLMALLPVILFSSLGPARGKTSIRSKGVLLVIRGASVAVNSPSWLTVRDVIFPTFRRIGLASNIELLTGYMEGEVQGWHTDSWTSKGLMTVLVKPLKAKLEPFVFEKRDFLKNITTVGYVPNHLRNEFSFIVERELRAAPAGELRKVIPARVQLGSFLDMSNIPHHFHLLLVARCKDPASSFRNRDARLCHIGFEQVFPNSEVFSRDLSTNPTQLMTHLAQVCVRGLMEELHTMDSVDSRLKSMLVLYQVLSDGFSSTCAYGPMIAEQHAREHITYARDHVVATSTQQWQTSEWIAEQMAGVQFQMLDGMYGCFGLGLE